MPHTTVFADLSLSTEEGDIRITGEGRSLAIDLPSLRAGVSMVGTGPSPQARGARIVQLHHALRGAGLTADVRLRGVPLARLGADARPGALARLFRLETVEIRPGKPLLASIRRHPGITAATVASLAALGFFLNKHRK